MYTGALFGVETRFHQSTGHEKHKKTTIFLSYHSLAHSKGPRQGTLKSVG